jgi:hypothetical protein
MHRPPEDFDVQSPEKYGGELGTMSIVFRG